MTFTTLHIVLTATLTGVAALIVGMWRLPRERRVGTISPGLRAGGGARAPGPPGSALAHVHPAGLPPFPPVLHPAPSPPPFPPGQPGGGRGLASPPLRALPRPGCCWCPPPPPHRSTAVSRCHHTL